MTADTTPAAASRRGFAYGITAYLLWGLFPLFWPLLEPASALEILAWRILLSLVVVGALLAAQRRLKEIGQLERATVLRLIVAGGLIAINWGAYIWGVNNGHVIETSLGYFINPLITVAIGVVVLHERLRTLQRVAIGLGAIAVVLLSIDYGRPPWLSLVLAGSFATYGLIKKRTRATAPEGLFIESASVAVPAGIALAVLALQGSASFVGSAASPGHLLLLAASGPMTAIPLLFFAGAARRLPLSTLGMLQYLAPGIQFAVGVLVRHEPMPPTRLACFVLVWIALVMLAIEGLRHRSRLRVMAATPEAIAVISFESSITRSAP